MPLPAPRLLPALWLCSLILPSYSTNLLVNNPNLYQQPPVGIFGDTIVNQRHSQINILFAYSIPTDKVTTTLDNGTAEVSNSLALISTTAASNRSAALNSKVAIQYIPGHDTEYLFSAAFTTGVANSTQWIGALTTNDGFAIGYNGANFSLLYRNYATGSIVNDYTTQANFNIDPLDGTGPSGIILAPTTLNVFKISFGWLGTAPIIFWILRNDGKWFKFHTIQRPNSTTVPTVSIPMLPIRAEVTNTSNTSNIQLRTGSWMGGTIGEDDATIVRIYSSDVTSKASVGTTLSPIFSLKNNTTYKSKTNYLNLKLLLACFSAQATASSPLTRFTLLKGATTSGTSFTDYDASNSIAQVNASPGTLSANGTVLANFLINGDGYVNMPILTNGMQIVLLPGETVTMAGSVSSGTMTVNTSLTWVEPVA